MICINKSLLESLSWPDLDLETMTEGDNKFNINSV